MKYFLFTVELKWNPDQRKL